MADDQLTTRAYVYTFVNEYGEEGPPSPESDEITVGTNAGVLISAAHAPVAAKYGIVSKRVYRSATGDEGTVFRLVTEIPLAQTAIADTLRDDELKEVLPSTDWDPPPNDLTGVVALSGDMLAGWRGGQEPGVPEDKDYSGPGILCISEPGSTHAWPIKYRLRFDFPILGVCPLDMGFVVFTEEETYFVAGTNPDQFQIRKCPSAPRCIGRKSIVSTGAYGYYASAQGPVMTDGQTFRYLLEATDSVTDPTRLFAGILNEQVASDTGAWGKSGAEDLRRGAASFAAVTDNRLLMSFFYDATQTGGTADSEWTFELFEFDLASREFPFLCGRWSHVCDATVGEEFLAGHLYLDKLTRTIYTMRGVESTSSVNLARLMPRGADDSIPADCEWNSKEFTFQRPFQPGVIYLDFNYKGGVGGSALEKVRIKIYALHGDYEALIADEGFTDDPSVGGTISPHNWIRRVQVLPGPRSHRIKVKVLLPSGYPVEIRRLIIAENMQELVERLPTA